MEDNKENKDELIQRLLDEQNSEVEKMLSEMADDADMQAYNIVYDTLKEKPAQGLSYSFKPSLMRRIELEKKQADDTKFYIVLGVVALVGIIAIVTMFSMFSESLSPVAAVLNKFKGYIIIIITAIILSTILDQKLVKKQR
jgi:anti-sigma factor RsiW